VFRREVFFEGILHSMIKKFTDIKCKINVYYIPTYAQISGVNLYKFTPLIRAYVNI